MLQNNITLIGMPGAGKSTIGIILAKNLSFGFIDTDVLIQINQQQSLQQIMDESGYLHLRKIEESEILKINIDKHVIATGGSAVYSEKAMQHLQSISTVIFLKVEYEALKKRIHNFKIRGIAKSDTQSFRELYDERQALYNRYGRIIIDCRFLGQGEISEQIVLKFKDLNQ